MTRDEAIAKTTAIIDAHIDDALTQAEITLRDAGATDAELEDYLSHHRSEQAAWREQTLQQIAGWIDRCGDEVH